jgi:peptide/nickel transport system ATP-binding protein
MSLLEVDRLTVALSDGRARRPILDDVSLRVEQGETVALVGESGSGKSVTARSVLGLLPRRADASGAVRVDGADVLAMDPRELRALRSRTVSMVFQDPRASVNPARRIGDFLTEGLRTNLGEPPARARDRVVELLEHVGFPDPVAVLRRYPHELSGGMLQRVMIAAALAGGPRLLLADEPTTALDVTTQAEVVAILMRLRAEHGLGLLFVTHDLELAAAICDRVYVMYAGRIVETQAVAPLFDRPLHPYTAGLLASTPSVAASGGALAAIPGRPVGLDEAPEGCPFAPRCPYADERSRQERPELEPLRDGLVACWHARELSLVPAQARSGNAS